MKYQGILNKSRTYDALALLTMLDAAFIVLMEEASNLGITPYWYAIIRLAGNGLLAYLRSVTTGPVGAK